MGEYGVANRSVAEIVSVAIGGMLERVAHQYLIWQDRSDDIEAIAREVLAFIRGGLMSVLMNPGQSEVAKGDSRR